MVVNVTYAITEDDQLAFNRFVSGISQHNIRKRILAMRLYGIFATSFGIFLLLFMSFSPEIGSIGLLCIFFGLFIGLMPEWSVAVWKRRMLALVRRPEFQKYLGTRTATIEATGLRVVGQAGERLLLWDGLTHAETPTLDIFHLAPADAIVIPRRAFTSDEHRKSFLAAVEAAKSGVSTAQTQTWWTQSGVAVEPQRQSNRAG